MRFDHNKYRYASKRNSVYGKNGMIATSSPIATGVGIEILKKGGNAIDAAIGTAATLSVVEPTANGIGGDLFSIIWFEGGLYGLNSSGHAPERMSVENIKSKGHKEIIQYGFTPVTVPGIPKGWAELSEKFGILSLETVLEPAAKIAEEGFVLSGALAYMFERAYRNYKREVKNYPEIKTWFDFYTEDGKLPKAGDIFKIPEQAKALREIAKTNSESFYKGRIADDIDSLSKKYDGFIRKSDLEKYEAQWVKPYSTNYRGYDIWELPPNGIGIIALMALNNLENMELGDNPDSIDTYHKRIESLKLAFSDGKEYIGEPDYMKVNPKDMIDKNYAKKRSKLISKKAMDPKPGSLPESGTVYLSTADKDGNMVSLIQSCYTGFGSGIILPGWGIALHNRGALFTLEENKSNTVMPGKRPYHTIIPGFITKDNRAIGPFGIMGGGMQPQAHLQVVSNLIDFNMNPQEALDAPRWQWIEGKKVNLEDTVNSHIGLGLIHKGHEISISPENLEFGRGQIILKQENGSYIGGTESRTDGHISVY